MRMYLDEDVADPLLAKFLRAAGHDVLMPADVGMMEKSDSAQFRYAITHGGILLTGNHDDFKDLHDLVLIAGGHHPGVLAIRRDNDPTKDMSLRAIVRAVGKVAAAMPDPRDSFQVLNHWR